MPITIGKSGWLSSSRELKAGVDGEEISPPSNRTKTACGPSPSSRVGHRLKIPRFPSASGTAKSAAGNKRYQRPPPLAAHRLSVYPAWRAPTGPGFIPLGGHPQKSPAERGFDFGERIKRVRGSRRRQKCAPDCRVQSGNGSSVARVAARPPVPPPVQRGAHPVVGRRGGGSRAASVPPAL